MRRRVTIEFDSDATPGIGGERGFLVRSHKYLPSSVIRGGLAARWIAEFGPPTQSNRNRSEFLDIFHGDIRFGPAFAGGTAVEPMSAKVCKYKPKAECHTWAVDLAFGEDKEQCSCGGPPELGKGRILGMRLGDRTRTAIDPDTQTAKDGHLFRRETIPSGTSFNGYIRGSHSWLDGMSGGSVWFGGKRTVSGRSVFKLDDVDEPDIPTGNVLVIRFSSPAVLVDDAALPRVNFTTAVAASLLDVHPTGVSAVQAWTRLTWVGGWHIASGLPKPQDIAFASGSTLRVDLADPIPPDRLKILYQRGIGVRTEEGYGSFEFVTRAWRPPPAATHEREEPTSQLWRRLLGMEYDDRKWAGNLLRDRLRDHQAGHALAEITHRRLRGWTSEEAEEFRIVAASENASEWSRLATLLLDEGDDQQ